MTRLKCTIMATFIVLGYLVKKMSQNLSSFTWWATWTPSYLKRRRQQRWSWDQSSLLKSSPCFKRRPFKPDKPKEKVPLVMGAYTQPKEGVGHPRYLNPERASDMPDINATMFILMMRKPWVWMKIKGTCTRSKYLKRIQWGIWVWPPLN